MSGVYLILSFIKCEGQNKRFTVLKDIEGTYLSFGCFFFMTDMFKHITIWGWCFTNSFFTFDSWSALNGANIFQEKRPKFYTCTIVGEWLRPAFLSSSIEKIFMRSHCSLPHYHILVLYIAQSASSKTALQPLALLYGSAGHLHCAYLWPYKV